MSNPLRIYVLHHPDSQSAERLTNRIYDWFRLPNLEGIPVYVRSAPAADGDRPAMPARERGDSCLEYIVPLVDAHMVRDPVWHEYLREIANGCAESAQESSPEWGWAMFPVALDSTAFNMPEDVTRTNFIRYGTKPAPAAATAAAPSPVEQEALAAYHASEAEEVLKHLTEAFARDLSARLFQAKAERFKIFISYARADGTEVPKALRNYIQGRTQCLVFFDENDIGFGQAFDESISMNVSDHARAMIVVNGDHYAERPWCRWEIERFTRPRPLPLAGAAGTPSIQVFQPILVVDTMSGPKMSRMVPELAQAPVVRWAEGREMACFSTLMREAVFGLRAVMVARTIAPSLRSGVVVNRLPGPVTLARLLPGGSMSAKADNVTVHYPGHGLPLAELRLIERTFPSVRFRAFRDINNHLPAEMKSALLAMEHQHGKDAPLHGKVIVLSTAHHRPDLAALGYLSQHQDEALIHLLRPLLRLGADLMYGGIPPRRGASAGAELMANRNITLMLLQLLSNERQVVEIHSSPQSAPSSMLFNIASWPGCEKVTATDEASWINSCRLKRVMPADAGLPAWPGTPPDDSGPLPPGYRRTRALVFSRLREVLAEGFDCSVSGDLRRRVEPAAFVFIGGAVDGFKGVMPGVMEEFLRAAQAQPPVPIYLMGGLGGATRILASALLDNAGAGRPPELTQEYYRQQAANAAEYNELLNELERNEADKVKRQFADLWKVISTRRGRGKLENLFSNGLDDAENRELLETENTVEAVELIWTGMSRVFLAAKKPKPPRRPDPVRRSRSRR